MNSHHGYFGYYINLDERGEFYADVRDRKGATVFEIRVGPDDEGGIFEDGFMRHKADVKGLTDHLRELRVIPPQGVVLPMAEFESLPVRKSQSNGPVPGSQ